MKYDGALVPGDSRQLVRSYDGPGMLTSIRTLARAMLSLTDPHSAQAGAPAKSADDRRQWGVLASNIHRERSRRINYLPAELFGEPAWDILLDLADAARANELRSIKSACLSSHAPEAPALRYIDRLLHFGLVERIDDKTDRRRKFLRLTALGERKMEEFLASMPPLGDHGEDLIRYIAQLG
jgi:hypothetical protein